MAFRILSFDELELLTENQRKSYEEELAIYNERVKFVEQIEKLENAVIKPYEPKLEAIPSVCEVPDGEFERPEYEFVKFAPVIKLKSNMAEFRFDEPVMALVPEHAKISNVPIGQMKNVERDKPVLPIISKAAAPVDSFAMAEQQRPILPVNVKVSIPDSTFNILEQTNPNLPAAAKPQNFTDLFFTPVVKEVSPAITVKNSERVVPVMEAPAFAAPEIVSPMLPKPEVEFPAVSAMEPPELPAPVLPKVAAAGKTDVSWKKTAKIKAELPEIFHAAAVQVLFNESDIQETKLPAVQKAEIPAGEFTAAEFSVYDFPMISVPQAHVPAFIAPKLGKPAVQAVEKPAVSPAFSFTVPELGKPVEQAVEKPAVSPAFSFTVPELGKPIEQAVEKPAVSPAFSFTVPELGKPIEQAVEKPIVSPGVLFTVPELEKPIVQAVEKLDVSLDFSFTMAELEKLEIQAGVKPTVSPSFSFAAPEFEKPAIQAVAKAAANPSFSFTAPELDKPAVQPVIKLTEIPKPYDGKLFVNDVPQMEYPSMNVLTVKSFEKVHSKASGLPAIQAVSYPDDCAEELLKIRLSIQKEYETKKEGFA